MNFKHPTYGEATKISCDNEEVSVITDENGNVLFNSNTNVLTMLYKEESVNGGVTYNNYTVLDLITTTSFRSNIDAEINNEQETVNQIDNNIDKSRIIALIDTTLYFTNIQNELFCRCYNLEIALFPYTKIIGDNVFHNCEKLKNVNLNSCTLFGDNVFIGCNSLKILNCEAITFEYISEIQNRIGLRQGCICRCSDGEYITE